MKLKSSFLTGTFIVLFAVVNYPLSDYTLAAPKIPQVKSAGEEKFKKNGDPFVPAKCKSFRNSFAVGDKIYADGKHLFPNTAVKIYIVAQDERCLWKFGDSIGADVSGGAETVTTTAKRKLPCTEIWGSASAGNYDIVVDANQNGIYDSGDAVDSISVGTGFSVGTQPFVLPAGSDDTDLDGTCDNGQFSFLRTEDVYADGSDFLPGDSVDIYVIKNQGWTLGDNIGTPMGTDDGDGSEETATTTVDDPLTLDVDEGGNLPCTKIWANPLKVGKYDIVVDVNQNAVFDAGDVVNNMCYEWPVLPGDQLTGAGFIVQPTLLTSYNTPGSAEDVFVSSGTTAYVADGSSGLQILDVSTTPPTFLTSYNTPGFANGVYVDVAGSKAYVADGNGIGIGLEILDISTTPPTFLTSYDTPGSANGVYVDVAGNKAYVADGSSGLQILDVSTTPPTLLGSYDTPASGDFANGVYVDVAGSKAYVAYGSSGLQIIDVTTPATPALLTSYNTPGSAEDVFVSGTTAYVADGGAGLQILNVSTTPPTLLGSIDTSSYAFDVYVTGNRAYMADGSSGLQVIDVSDLTAPAWFTSYNTPGEARGIYISGTTIAYVADESSGLQIIDVTE